MVPSQYASAEIAMPPLEHFQPTRLISSGKRHVDGSESVLYVKKQKIGEQGKHDGSVSVHAQNLHALTSPASWRMDDKVGVQGGVVKGITAN
jgi:hypothetical protein